MIIIACDYHPSFQQIVMLDQNSGELSGRRLAHPAEAEVFYRSLRGPVRVGMEAIGNSLWFERLLAELGHELWIGDAARVRAMAVSPQKTDARCRSPVAAAVAGPFSADLGTLARGTRSAAVCCGIGTSWCRCAHR